MKFGTLINCLDGRVQYPVMDYLKKNHDVEFFDAANEAGPIKILTERTEKCRLISLKEQVRTSLEEHDSKLIVLAGHHDCTDNPVDRPTQEQQMREALDYLKRGFGESITYVGIYVNEQWQVEELIRWEP